jgi:hypothetical protein
MDRLNWSKSFKADFRELKIGILGVSWTNLANYLIIIVILRMLF